MDLRLKGKKALVGGASKGLGFAVAKSLAREGCNLLICARDASQIKATAQSLQNEYGVEVASLACDLSQERDRAELMKAADAFGPIDILINNVGGPNPSKAALTTDNEWRTGFELLFMSATQLTQHFVKNMMKNKFGRIITITSITVTEPIDDLVVSTSMRAAVTGFHKTLAREVAEFGVTVNTVRPGIIHTDRIDFLREERAKRLGTTRELELEKSAASVPMKRLGRPEELADFICFLASEKASYITGQSFCIDGGLSKSLL